ncbi:MAG: ABC transporter ATP-binding protein [Rhodoferax sp.]|nr:ABC transporter ATP-binding protein [Rhodoferax sp.]
MAYLELTHLHKSYGEQAVVHDFSLSVARGEFVTFLGPSGCGKTTVLRMIAGLEAAQGGQILLEGQDITHLPTAQRHVGMVFQAYALFPNLTVAENVGFGLRVAGVPAADRARRVAEMLDRVELPHLGARYPWQLSGGQQQRVALARALANEPRVLLLDEPLSALDAKIRESLRESLRALQRSLGLTTIFVTHDQEEALALSDRVVVMQGGRIEQVGNPATIYNRPGSAFVADFVGTLNRLRAQVYDAAAGRLLLGKQLMRTTQSLAGRLVNSRCELGLRPEALRLLAEGHPDDSIEPAHSTENVLEGEVQDLVFQGAVVRMRVRIEGQPEHQPVQVALFNDPLHTWPERGQRVRLGLAADSLMVL